MRRTLVPHMQHAEFCRCPNEKQDADKLPYGRTKTKAMPETSEICTQHYQSPCGDMLMAAIGDSLCLCDWTISKRAGCNMRRLMRHTGLALSDASSPVLCEARKQLDEYFSGTRRRFDIKLAPAGTDFQKCVWAVLHEMPYGQTCTYADVARRAGNAKGVRAVAQAIGANGISIIIPCHRVVGADRSLTGYAGGLEAKRFLLGLEHDAAARQPHRP